VQLPGPMPGSFKGAMVSGVVKLKKGQLCYFRKLSRDTDYEILAYLIGEVISPTITIIDSFEYTSQYAQQTENSVCWFQEDYDHVKEKAESEGKRIVGFIHSHPQWDAVMSEADYKVCISEGYRVCGIVSTYGNKTRARFWSTDSAIPFKQVYIRGG